MRKLSMIALLWVTAPALSMAAAAPGSFEGMAQAARDSVFDTSAVLPPRSTTVSTVSLSNYSLAAPNRDANAGGLKTQALQSSSFPRLVTPASFSEGTAVNTAGTLPAAAVTPAVDASVSPIPEPQTYALMIAGLAALGFMATRRGRG